MKRRTSVEAYHSCKESGLLSGRRWQVYEVLYHHGPLTAGEIFQRQGMGIVKGSICARLTELREMQVVYEVGERICSLTGNKAILWDVTEYAPVKPAKKPKGDRVPCSTCGGSGFLVEEPDQQVRLFA